ncbi:MAG: biotin/lipoyl-binding protein, partial [Gemmatimonadaceae bacterium]
MRSYSLQILVAATALLSACGDDDAAASEVASRAARSVSVHVVRDEPLAPAVLATGTIAGKEEVPLSFKIGGLIARIAVEEGQRVSEGQVLAELSPTEISALVARATEGRTKARRDL